MRMMLLHQFTFTSAPHIWSGDELGMWGADDPDCRKPLLWDDVKHRPQVFAPDGRRHRPIPVKPDMITLSPTSQCPGTLAWFTSRSGA